MALSGNLNEFSVLETLQVIALQQKTGTLRIRSGKSNFGLHFREGRFIGCQPENPTEPDAFLDTLIGLGQLGKDEERRIRMLASDRGVDLWRQISESVKLEPETLEETRTIVLQGVLDRVLLWNKGKFDFESGPVPPVSGPPWNVETAMLESMRRLDEAADLRAAGFSHDCVPELLSTPSESAYEAENPVPASLERALLSRIDGKASVAKLIETLNVAEYEVLTALRDLKGRGVVKVDADRPSNSVTQILIEQPMRLRKPALAVFLLVASLAAVATGHAVRTYSRSHTIADITKAKEQRASVRHRTAVLQGLEIYRQRAGHYPTELAALIEESVWPQDAQDVLSDQPYRAEGSGAQIYRWGAVRSDERIDWDAVTRSSQASTPDNEASTSAP